MVRLLNFLCVAAMGLSILALYHVSEATRVAQMRLHRVDRQIADARGQIGVLETEWERIAGPARVEALAEQKLGMTDTASVQLSSFAYLPRRGEEESQPLGGTPLRNASAVVPVQPQMRPLPVSDRPGL